MVDFEQHCSTLGGMVGQRQPVRTTSKEASHWRTSQQPHSVPVRLLGPRMHAQGPTSPLPAHATAHAIPKQTLTLVSCSLALLPCSAARSSTFSCA